MERNKQIFDDYIEGMSISDIADIFKVSEAIVKKWKSKKGVVPYYVVEIIELRQKNYNLQRKIDNLNFEMVGMKQSIHNYFNHQDQLRDLIKQ